MTLTRPIQLTEQVEEKRRQNYQTTRNVLRRMKNVQEGLQHLEDAGNSDRLTFMYAVPNQWEDYTPYKLSDIKKYRFDFLTNNSERKSVQREGMLDDPVYQFLRMGYDWARGEGRDTHLPTHKFFYALDTEFPEYLGLRVRRDSFGTNFLHLLYQIRERTMDENTYTALGFVVDSLVEQGFLKYQNSELQTGLTINRRKHVFQNRKR